MHVILRTMDARCGASPAAQACSQHNHAAVPVKVPQKNPLNLAKVVFMNIRMMSVAELA